MTDPGLARMRKRSTSLECLSACTKGPRSQSRASQPASRDALEAALNRVSCLYVAGGLHVAVRRFREERGRTRMTQRRESTAAFTATVAATATATATVTAYGEGSPTVESPMWDRVGPG